MQPVIPQVDILGLVQKYEERIRRISKAERKSFGSWQEEPYNIVKSEENLWLAVITQALIDALCNNPAPQYRRLKTNAMRWLIDADEEFMEVCHRAGVDPITIRRNAKKAIANPIAYRTELGKSVRYLERRAMRERRRQKRNEQSKQETETTTAPCVIPFCNQSIAKWQARLRAAPYGA